LCTSVVNNYKNKNQLIPVYQSKIMPQTIFIDDSFEISKIDPVFRSIFRSALPFLETRKNLIHTFIVYQYAHVLLKHEHGAPEIILPACILHDVGWSVIPEMDQLKAFKPGVRDETLRKRHETAGATIAAEILAALDYQDGLIKKIVSIIDGHDTSRKARSQEDAVAKDADKLWRFSAAGFRIDVERFEIRPRRHIDYLQEHIDEWFLTGEGRAIAIHEVHQRKLAYGL
jgi:HD superfamily phosphodiesterase